MVKYIEMFLKNESDHSLSSKSLTKSDLYDFYGLYEEAFPG